MSAYPDWDPPFYWCRVWTGATEMDEVTVFERQPDGTMMVMVGVPEGDLPEEKRRQALVSLPLAPDGLVIYGRAVVPEIDREQVERDAERGLVFSECFSIACPEGELGTHPLAAVTEISRDEFERARARGWS